LRPLVFVFDAVGWYSVSCKFSVQSEVIIGCKEEEEEQIRLLKYPTPIVIYKIREVDEALNTFFNI
jgi:hypothetical protein